MADHLPFLLVYHNVAFPVLRCRAGDLPLGEDGATILGVYQSDILALQVRGDLAPAQAWSTLFHELCHHALETSGGSKEAGAEDLCNWFGWMMVDVLMQNPELQKQMLLDLAGGRDG
jgi:hypothetical protein